MQKPKLSVVIPLFNKQAHIQRALHSVISQQHACAEIIVVDDGSTDQSAEQVNTFILQHNVNISLIRQQNSGVSVARNVGIEHCSYDHVLLLDADDIWLPQFSQEIVNLIERFPNAGLWATHYAFKQQHQIIPAKVNAVPNDYGLIADYFNACIKADLPITASSVCLFKPAFNNIGGFPVGMAMGEDQLVWSRIAYQFPIAFANKLCVHYDRAVQDSACKTNLITELAPHVLMWQQDIANHNIPSHLLPSLHQLLHFSALYCVKNNIKLGNNKRALVQLFNQSLIKKDRYWLAGVMLACLPQIISSRVI